MKTQSPQYSFMEFESLIKLATSPITLLDAKIDNLNSMNVDGNFYNKCNFEYCLDLFLNINNIFSHNIDSIKVVIKKNTENLVPKKSEILVFDVNFLEKIKQFKTAAMLRNERVNNSMMIKPAAAKNIVDFESTPGFGGAVGKKIKTFKQHNGRIDITRTRRKYRGFKIESMIALHKNNARMSNIINKSVSALKAPENFSYAKSMRSVNTVGKSILLVDENQIDSGNPRTNIEDLILFDICNVKNGKIQYSQNNRTSSPYFHVNTPLTIPGAFLSSGNVQISIKAYSKNVMISRKNLSLNHDDKIDDIACFTKKPEISFRRRHGAYEIIVVDNNPDPGGMVLQCSVSSPDGMYLNKPKKFEPTVIENRVDERIYRFVLTSEHIHHPFKYVIKAGRINSNGSVTSTASTVLSPSLPAGRPIQRPQIGAGCKVICYNVRSGIAGMITNIPWQIKKITVMRQNVTAGDVNENIGTFTSVGKTIKFTDPNVRYGHTYRYFYVYNCEDLTIQGTRTNRLSISDFKIKHVPPLATYVNFTAKIKKQNNAHILRVAFRGDVSNLQSIKLNKIGFASDTDVLMTPDGFAIMFKVSAFNIKVGRIETIAFLTGHSELDVTRYRENYTHFLVESCMLHRVFALGVTSRYSPYYLRTGIIPNRPYRADQNFKVAFNQCRQGDCILVSARNTNLNTSTESVSLIEAKRVFKKYNLIKWSMSDIFKLSDESKDVDYFIVVATFCQAEYVLGTVERIAGVKNYSFVDLKLSKSVGDVHYRIKMVLNDHTVVESNVSAKVSTPFNVPVEIIGKDLITGI